MPPPRTFRLPSWESVSAKQDAGEDLDALEAFIWNNTPAGLDAERQFRDDLEAAIRAVLPTPISLTTPRQEK